MIDQDELMKMAREAGFLTGALTGGDGSMKFPVIQSVGNGNCFVELQALACAILERAAVECESSFFGNAGELNHEVAEAVRALKPKQEA